MDTSPRICPTREDWKRTPPSASGVSVLALIAAGVISLTWPSSADGYAGFVGVLAFIPVFLTYQPYLDRSELTITDQAPELLIGQ